MLFASLPFLIGFLPVVLAGTGLARRFAGTRGAIYFLSAASLVFYGWTYPWHVGLLIGSVCVNYLLGRLIAHTRARRDVIIGIAFNLGALAWFKYAGFFALSANTLLGASFDLGAILLPLGISFITFQKIAYLVDVYARRAEPHGLLDYTFFVVFFPQLIAGPIVHHSGFIPQLKEERFARFRTEDVAAGAALFAMGLAKKTLLADQLRFGADRVFEAAHLGVAPSMGEAWLGVARYTLQIYFDFPAIPTWRWGWGACSASSCRRISNRPTNRARSSSSGGAGTSRCRTFCATISTSRLAETGTGLLRVTAICGS
jgi:D-alanyl-lipoteichoic acid acyltransferase DltB (MBOAT superfamily)